MAGLEKRGERLNSKKGASKEHLAYTFTRFLRL